MRAIRRQGRTRTSQDIESQKEASSLLYKIQLYQEIKHNLLKHVCKCLHFFIIRLTFVLKLYTFSIIAYGRFLLLVL